MNRKLAATVMIILMSALGLSLKVHRVEASGTIYIRADGSVEGTDKIQREENIYIFVDDINGSIVVDRDNITIDGAGYTLQGIGDEKGVDLTGRKNVTIKNTNIKNFEYGIYLWDSVRNSIIENKITNNGYGIYLYWFASNYTTISRNNITANRWSGIYLYSLSNYNTIIRNNITKNGDYGIELVSSSYNNITENSIKNNDGWGVSLEYYSNYNTINGNNIANNERGIFLDSSRNNSIIHNNITANSESGIFLFWKSNKNTIRRNYIANNSYGLRFAGPKMWSNGVPIYENPSLNLIQENNIENNREAGLKIENSSDNIFYHNNFLNNTIQIHSVNSTNTWDNGYPSGGNFWSDYNGTDTNNDGIEDTPYVVDEKNKDRYPLMNPWTPSEHQPVTPPAPFWMQWWLWAILAVVIVALAGAVYFLKKRKPPAPTAPTTATDGT